MTLPLATTRAVALVLAVALPVAACSGPAKPTSAPGPPPTSTQPASPAASPSTSASANSAARHRMMGETVVLYDNGAVDATVLSYQQPAKTTAPKPETPGAVWAAADVRVCQRAAIEKPISVSSLVWALLFADGGVVEPSSITYRQFPQPAYPIERTIQVGQCVRGWIVFPVPGVRRPVVVEYAPQSLDVPVDWAVT